MQPTARVAAAALQLMPDVSPTTRGDSADGSDVSAVSTDSLQLFFSAATQYYVTGRCAVLVGHIPVAGNLLHHAVEMYLKGGLAKTTALQQLRALSHDLPRIWSAFKGEFADPALSGFDTVVSSLHAFEELRYPDSILSKGMLVNMGIVRLSVAGPGTPPRPEPAYELYLEDVDALVDKIF